MKKNNKQRLLGLLIILVGICTMAYPRIANYVNQQFAVNRGIDNRKIDFNCKGIQ